MLILGGIAEVHKNSHDSVDERAQTVYEYRILQICKKKGKIKPSLSFKIVTMRSL